MAASLYLPTLCAGRSVGRVSRAISHHPCSTLTATQYRHLATATSETSLVREQHPPPFTPWSAKTQALLDQDALQAKRRTMPPGYKAGIADLKTFIIPPTVTGNAGDMSMGKALIEAFRKDGILQIQMDSENTRLAKEAFNSSKDFFALPSEQKKACVDDQSFAGYIASGEELTDGIADYSEIFTVTKDLPLSDPRVQAKWPCHGPCPWPNRGMQQTMQAYMDYLGSSGERLPN